ncbi:TNF receptor-associated factor family protein DDB_G0290965 isoform X2 [Manihot esculenta]|uniref:TNF receptor-associated factor family protein DDB_G0290965 isoform X2 n=1 Tax=Manihot esculenta TaxID=3983 RepID=UPI000B5D6618|nr:TNF receptor-associated factor family protein DDB_G0290965 isoform X2 [Manihot esculenta]
MDPPTTNVEVVPEKETIEDGKEGCPAFHCDLYDIEIVYKITLVFLPGLAAACVDNTTGGIFRSPASVAVDLRKEMIEYLTQRSESFVAETVILEDGTSTEVSDPPYDIISDFVDDFSSSKRNFFSRVSGWVLSETREDKIDDFVQEMEENGFWLTDRREVIAQTLLKNVDFKNMFHCDKKFNTAEELAEHVANCEYRSMNCNNEGCTVAFCAKHMENHDSTCPFKMLPCEQKCSDSIMRREMDRHCITVCPMKLVNCPFYAVGCQSTVPRSMIRKHCLDDLHLHLVYALKNIHKGATEEDLKERVDQIVQTSSGQLEAARDARSLTLRVKDLDAKLGPLKVSTVKKVSEDPTEAANKSIEESPEDGNGGVEKSINTINNVSEESTEAANHIKDRSFEAATDMADKADKSSDAINKAIEASSEAGDDGAEKSTNTINKVGEESIETGNSTAHASEEAKN